MDLTQTVPGDSWQRTLGLKFTTTETSGPSVPSGGTRRQSSTHRVRKSDARKIEHAEPSKVAGRCTARCSRTGGGCAQWAAFGHKSRGDRGC